MTFEPSTANVLSVYSNASAEAIREGLSWYLRAFHFSRELDPQNPRRAAGIIAALSPMNGWDNNKRKAAQLYAQNGDGAGCGMGNNVRKAVAIYNGADPLDVLGGDKVRAFFSTIDNPWGFSDPVIDRHAFDIAVGKVTDDKSRGMLSRKGMYHTFAECFVEAARIAGISASQMQAVTWIAWREWKGIVDG